jgi:hypothetical protein
MRLFVLACSCLMAFISLAYASEDVNADDWAEECGSPVLQGVCAGAVANTVDLIETYHKATRSTPGRKLVCWNENWFERLASADQDRQISGYLTLAQIGVQYLHEHPGLAKEPYTALLIAAFMRKWPCGQVGPLNK